MQHLRIILLVLLALQPLAKLAASEQPPTTTITVDFNRPTGTVNRALFSLQGFMQAYTQPNPMVMESFKLTNPEGTQTRLEIWPHLIEPQNDDADPNHFNWDAMHPEKMIRMIDDFDSFMHVVEDELGMEPLALITYNNAEWMKSNNPDDPVASHEEWAEFAAAVVETFNGRDALGYRPRLRFAQLWNEPNMPHFYGGSMESYFNLFNTTSKRLHENYPGIITGGPNISHAWHAQPKEWMQGFIDNCGQEADFIVFHHYGPEGESPEVIFNDIRERAEKFRAIPGKENGKIMITETDAWYDGWPKIQFVMERQFGFLRLSDYLLGVHHFCVMAYNESGNYTFGTIDEQGGVIQGVFWPYWIFRNLIGDTVHASAVGHLDNMEYIASRDIRDGKFLGTAVIWNKGTKPVLAEPILFFPPSPNDRVLAVNKITENFQGLDAVYRIPAGIARFDSSVRLLPGEAIALTIQQPGERHFAFADINNQQRPWLAVQADTREVPLGGKFTIKVEILNTTFKAAKGTIRLGGMPDDWTVTPVGEHKSIDLSFGARNIVEFEVTAASLPHKNMAGIYAWLDAGSAFEPGKSAHSIPVTIEVIDPVVSYVLPSPVFAVRGEATQLDIQLESQFEGPLDVGLELELPGALSTAETNRTVTLQPGERTRVAFPFNIPDDAPETKYEASVSIRYAGQSARRVAIINVTKPVRDMKKSAVTVDLTKHYNFDSLAYFKNREDITPEMGMFIFPADFTPLGRKINYYGIPYHLPPADEGVNNSIQTENQTIPVTPGRYSQVSFLGMGYDGFHPVKIKLIYTDGTSELVDTEIPQWCTPPPDGARVVFNAPHRYTPGGVSDPPCEWFAWEIPVDASRTLEAIGLPNEKAAQLYAITLLE